MFRWIIVNYLLTFEVNYPLDKENTEVYGLSILRMCCACLGERLFVRSLYSAARRVLLRHPFLWTWKPATHFDTDVRRIHFKIKGRSAHLIVFI